MWRPCAIAVHVTVITALFTQNIYPAVQASRPQARRLNDKAGKNFTSEHHAQHRYGTRMESIGHGQIQAGTLQDMTSLVTIYKRQVDKETEGEKWEDETLSNSVAVHSALRDTVEGKVRVFFDAKPWAHGFQAQCHFIQRHQAPEHWFSGNQEITSDPMEIEVEGKLIALHDNVRAYDGYILECDDPGTSYAHIVFRSHDSMVYHRLIKTIEIEEVEREEQHVFGMCSAPVFSQRIGFKSWLHDTVRANITNINVYYTEADERALNGLNGLRFRKDIWDSFVPEPLEGVHYFRYQAPVGRFYFSQSTLLNECMYRNRHSTRYIIVADADEFIHIQQPGLTLEEAVESHMGSMHASLLLNAIHYPRTCQPTDTTTALSLVESCHMFDPNTVRFDYPKSIVNPRRAGHFLVHGLVTAAEGFALRKAVDESVMFFKHIRNYGHCDEEQRRALADDHDVEQIVEYMQTAPKNTNWMQGV